MSDLIDRQKAVDVVLELSEKVADEMLFIDAIVDEIENIPSAEPERKKGEWSNYKDAHCCSVCHCVVISNWWDDDIRYDYCPY